MIHFIYLTAFSKTGGIEKFNRCFLLALQNVTNHSSKAISVYDFVTDPRYFSANNFNSAGGNKLKATWLVFKSILHYKTIIVGHINLAPFINVIKLLRPSVKIILIAHGIEVWQQQKGAKAKLLNTANEVWAVSNFTKNQILKHNVFVESNRIKIFYNTIDPYFNLPNYFSKPTHVLEQYNLSSDTKIILTVARLTSTEKFKGYYKVIENLQAIQQKVNPQKIHYLLCGKYSVEEKQKLDTLIQQYNVSNLITLTGFIKDEELVNHYLLADVFVMPSKKEGFGIVFIEALACGLPVIAGDKDGSVDALDNGNLGTLINPDDSQSLVQALAKVLNTNHSSAAILQQQVVEKFGFTSFQQRLKNYLLG